MEHRTPEEYRALIRGWRIRLKEKPHDLGIVLGEMQEEVPDYIPAEGNKGWTGRAFQ